MDSSQVGQVIVDLTVNATLFMHGDTPTRVILQETDICAAVHAIHKFDFLRGVLGKPTATKHAKTQEIEWLFNGKFAFLESVLFNYSQNVAGSTQYAPDYSD